MNEEDNHLEEIVINEKTVEGMYFKTSLLMNDNIKVTKFFTQCSFDDGTIAERNTRYGLNLNSDALGKAFYDAFVITYLPNVTKRYQDSFGVDAIDDVYGNKIEFEFNDIIYVYIGPNVTPELEQMYDKLIANVIEKVRTYGEDMEIRK